MKVEWHNLLEAHMNKNTSCFLKASGSPATYETLIEQVKNDSVHLRNTVPFDSISSFINSSEFSLNCVQITFIASSISTDGVRIIFPLNAHSTKKETREEERFSFKNDEQIKVRILNPYDKKTLLEKPVIDLSSSGVSFKTSPNSKLFEEGQFFESITIATGENQDKAFSGTVKYNRKYLDLKGNLVSHVGIKLTSKVKDTSK